MHAMGLLLLPGLMHSALGRGTGGRQYEFALPPPPAARVAAKSAGMPNGRGDLLRPSGTLIGAGACPRDQVTAQILLSECYTQEGHHYLLHACKSRCCPSS